MAVLVTWAQSHIATTPPHALHHATTSGELDTKGVSARALLALQEGGASKQKPHAHLTPQ